MTVPESGATTACTECRANVDQSLVVTNRAPMCELSSRFSVLVHILEVRLEMYALLNCGALHGPFIILSWIC